MRITETTAEDVINLFNVSDEATAKFEAWRNDPDRRDTVVPHVLGHRTRALYEIRRADIMRVKTECRHPLEDRKGKRIHRRDAEAVRSIAEWKPNYAFTHVMHYALETMGTIFTWQRFIHFCQQDRKARTMLWIPAEQKIAATKDEGWSYDAAFNAMQWRVGNFYYSFVREIHLISELRSHGISLQSHPLADALFRIDAWTDRTIFSLYVGNKKYRQGVSAGRKPRPEKILDGALQGFTYVAIELPPADRYGKVYLATAAAIERVARDLLSQT